MTKPISEMSSEEKFAEATRLQWDLDSKLRAEFNNSYDNFVTAQYNKRRARAVCLRQRGVTAEEEQKYETEWRNSAALQAEFHDMKIYVSYRCAEERQLIGVGGR